MMHTPHFRVEPLYGIESSWWSRFVPSPWDREVFEQTHDAAGYPNGWKVLYTPRTWHPRVIWWRVRAAMAAK